MTNEIAKTKIIIVDDHPIVREGISTLLNHESWISIIAQVSDARSALNAIDHERPDVMIIDIGLKDIDGLELTKEITSRYPEISILIMSMYDEMLFAERALRAGAKAYIMKQQGTDELVNAINKVKKGYFYLSDEIIKTIIISHLNISQTPSKNGHAIQNLSDREFNVFELIGKGYSNKQIAEILYLSVKTVETHRENIKKKLNIKSSTELMKYAASWMENVK